MDTTKQQQKTIPMALTGYGLPHVMGYLKTRGGEGHPSPVSAIDLMDAAKELGLSGIEVPLTAAKGFPVEPLPVEVLRDALQERGLRLIPDYMALTSTDVPTFRAFLEKASALGATVVRSTLSSILCGDRRPLAGGWEPHLASIAQRLNEVLPIAEEYGISIAMENHQDATSDDLLRLAEMTGHHPGYGVCLDAGNPLAVGEGPVEFARRLAPLIRHVHLKDYTIHFSPDGYRLVRCAAGDGVVDFAEILRIVRANGHEMMPGIEIAAQPTRTIPLLEDGWWACYPEKQAGYLVEALRVLWAKGRPMDEPYSSAWERGEDSAAVSAEEWDIVRRSAAYFHRLSGESA